MSCPVHAGARHAEDLVDHHGAARNRRSPSPSCTRHRSLNLNVTPPGLRPGAREGEPQARRCRSRVSVPSSAVERGPGRSARPVGRRHAGNLVDHHGAARNRRSPSPSCTGHRSLNLNVTPPGLRPGAREGEPQARRCRSRVSVPSSVVGRGAGRRLRPVGRRHAQAPRAGQRPAAPIDATTAVAAGRDAPRPTAGCGSRRRDSCPHLCQVCGRLGCYLPGIGRGASAVLPHSNAPLPWSSMAGSRRPRDRARVAPRPARVRAYRRR